MVLAISHPHALLETKTYGCELPGEASSEVEDEGSSYPRGAEGFQFAPQDVAPWQFEGKDDMHGIGYKGMEEQEVLRAQRSTKALYGMSGAVRDPPIRDFTDIPITDITQKGIGRY